MKAVLSRRYGSPEVLEIADIPRPEPGPGEIRIRVHASTVSRTDCGMLRGYPWFARLAIGLFRPKSTVLGLDFAGTVDAAGPGATRFRPGDRVFGLSPDRHGAHAEYLCLPEDGPVDLIPEGIEFDRAVICEGAWYAQTNLAAFGLGPGRSILIYGGSGAIGSAAVQLAKAAGAEVTAVVQSRHLALAAALGADHVVDDGAGDFTATDRRHDVVFDAVGFAPWFRCRHLLKPGGIYAATDLGPWGQNLIMPLLPRRQGRPRAVFPFPRADRALVAGIRARMEAGALRGVFDRAYPLNEIADAYRYVETAQKTGIVTLRIAG